MVCNKQNIEPCFNDIKLMLFWNGVNVIHSITFLLQYIKILVQKIISMTKVSTTDVNNIKERVKVNLEKAPAFSIPFVTETFSLKQLQSLKTGIILYKMRCTLKEYFRTLLK